VAAVVVENVTKQYGSLTALAGVSLRIEQGEVFCLLGPNGAGKTTLVEILEGHRRRSGGDVRVLGFDPAYGGRAFRDRIGIVLQHGGLDDELTVEETIAYYRSLYARPRWGEDVIALVGLQQKARARVKTLSGGQRRRLELALGIVGEPDLLFLDEPTTGFDPSARRQAWDLVRALRAGGKTILLTTHYMDEAQALADRIAVMARGRIVAEGTPHTLGDRHRLDARIRFRLPVGIDFQDLPPVAQRAGRATDGRVELHTAAPVPLLRDLTAWASARNLDLDDLTVDRPTLEDVYLDLTKEAPA
jgi:ABC-2 type transport system ATP-binding protein